VKDAQQLNEKNCLIQKARNQAIINGRSYGMMENEVEKAGNIAARRMEDEINKAEEAAKRARAEAKQSAKQARDAVKCANQSRAAIKKAGEDAMRNFPGQVGVL